MPRVDVQHWLHPEMASYKKKDDARPDESPWSNSLDLPP